MPDKKSPKKSLNKYDKIIEAVFFDNFQNGDSKVAFGRNELAEACEKLNLSRVKNLGDIPYSYRFRRDLPDSIRKCAPENTEWIIIGKGTGEYEFRQASPAKIAPINNRHKIMISDATPEIITTYSPGSDEQALLTKVRYNRLVDIFTGLTCYSLQNHLRTSVQNIGQIEIDEIYIGLNKLGTHFILPCQAKSIGDRFGIVQVMQDLEFCKQKYPELTCRAIALQFLSKNDIAILELTIDPDPDIYKLRIVDEKHYRLIRETQASR